MWPDQVSNPGPLTYKSSALLTALCGPARGVRGQARPPVGPGQCPGRGPGGQSHPADIDSWLFQFI